MSESASVSQHHMIFPSSKHPAHTLPIHHALLPHYPSAGCHILPATLYELPAIIKRWIRFKHDLPACHSLPHYLNSSVIALTIRGRCGFWASEVWNVVLTMKLPPLPLQGNSSSSSCLVVVRFSALCCITWGRVNPAVVGSGIGWGGLSEGRREK